MEFIFDEDQLLLQRTVHDFLESEVTPEVVRALWETETGRSPELWGKLAEIGLPGLLVPEAYGGMGMNEVDAVLLLEEAGRSGLAEPLVSTAAVAAPLLAELAGETAQEWLPKIASGQALVAVGHPVCPFVEDAHVASLLILPHDGALFGVAPGTARITPQKSNDPGRRIASVDFDEKSARCLAEGDRAEALLDAAFDRGALASAAAALGAGDRLISEAVAYTRQRKQFGQPIGAFQAVKHGLANCKVKLEYARPAVYRAAHSVAQNSPERSLHVSMAKLLACEAAGFAAKQALQAHGAIGYTWEQDLHIWMRRAWSLEHAFGRNTFHHDRVRRAVLTGQLPLGPGTTFTN